MEPELFDRIYETIANKEDTYDGVYYTGVLTTRIVCRPSCRARTPKKENIRLYPSVEAAIQAGFRPCKRCKPEAPGPHGPDRALAAQVDALIAQGYGGQLTLKTLAEQLAVSPFHLQRTYKRVTGHSPAVQLQRVRLQAARELLADPSVSMAEAGAAIGFRSPSHFAVWFRQETGLSPTEYRERHESGQPKEEQR
ncbi:bifunctional transcriptional activator/DNA repair enzyme AdaA [Paenibacillus caseinilyticus]|uniref:AraC family transcriptional regulator n=1 Tax=Paenibacillus mucilaginosus K02 TaxID=997761 RepID=I0BN13_9BACL|nr:Ada metal-binding domain-containing protein [Paenibacillus mucilaginosus]AFH63760.1 AraC family transcriptional regulator [Paenibacillus mucilaginosus K02]WFA19970.1 methylphosphotriester-DNA--protein-cysteine methyltransferase family protein [Paenibacillus mucilaginosus]